MERHERLLAECVLYFRERKGFDRLFFKMREKYISLGHFGGKVTLTALTEEDRQQLGGFFQKDYSGKTPVVISAAAMQKALNNSCFSELQWEEILTAYFEETLVPQKERKSSLRRQREDYFADLLEKAGEGPQRLWLAEAIQPQGQGHSLLMKHYQENPEQLRVVLRQVLSSIPSLPLIRARDAAASKPDEVTEVLERKLLAVFAAQTTGDPHFFDVGTLGEQLLTAFLKSLLPAFGQGKILYVQERAALYYEAGLLKDDLSNHTLVYGVHARIADGSLHRGVEGFLERKEPIQLTLRNLGGLSAVEAAGSQRVYIVENPAVFSMLTEAWPEETVVCGNGQVRLATLVLLDLFDERAQFYYAGDFDPEGLQIAQRLKERYGDRLSLWKYRREFYETYLSEVVISEKSLKKLDHIYLEELQEVKKAMLEEKRAAYQEAMLQEYGESMRKAEMEVQE